MVGLTSRELHFFPHFSPRLFFTKNWSEWVLYHRCQHNTFFSRHGWEGWRTLPPGIKLKWKHLVVQITSESESSSSIPSRSSVSRGLKPSLSLPWSRLPTPQSLPLLPSFPPRCPLPRFLHLRTARQTAMRIERGTDTAAAIRTELLMWRSGRMGADLDSVDAAFGLGREAGRGEEGAPEEEETVRKQPRTVQEKKVRKWKWRKNQCKDKLWISCEHQRLPKDA